MKAEETNECRRGLAKEMRTRGETLMTLTSNRLRQLENSAAFPCSQALMPPHSCPSPPNPPTNTPALNVNNNKRKPSHLFLPLPGTVERWLLLNKCVLAGTDFTVYLSTLMEGGKGREGEK